MMNSTKMMKKKVTFAEKVKSRKQEVDDEDLSDMPPQEGNEEEVKERKD